MGNLRFRQIHLDFHTSEHIEGVGEDFNAKDFANTLKEAGVDSITCFARGHHGMIYYDTEKFPNRHPHLKRNLLMEQIDACHAVGIRVPIYITVGWDEYIARTHPEWIERMPDGKPFGRGPLEAGWKTLCFNTPYVDLVERQTIDVLETFGEKVDGIFFDIIFQDACCCTYCMEGMHKAGLDPEIEAHRIQFADGVVNRFKQRLTDTIRKYNQECTIFYNAGHVGPYIRESLSTYSHLELESLPSGGWGYEHFPITARYAKNLDYEFLAMTGKFHKSWADFGGFKNQPALEYECFTAIANGAKCSVGDQLHPNGAINKATYKLIGSVYNQVKEKEAWCDDTTSVSEIAIMSPEIIVKERIRLHPAIRGAYRMLSEAHYQFDIIDDKMDFAKYKVIILPDMISLEDALKEKVEAYIKGGGKVLLSHKSGMDSAYKEFVLNGMGVELVGDAPYTPDYVVAGASIAEGLLDTEYVMYEQGLWVKPLSGTKVLAQIHNPYFNRSYKHFCSHAQTPVEKDSGYPAATLAGGVVYFSHPIFSMFAHNGLRAYKLMVLNSLKLLLDSPVLKTNAPTTAQIYFNYQSTEDRHIVHVLHYIPERRYDGIDTIEDIIPLYNISLKVKLPKKPDKAYLAPSGKALSVATEGEYTTVVIPEVTGHEMVVFE